jgi:UDP-N-acetylglucosamine 1-carboxyvinyltransferase
VGKFIIEGQRSLGGKVRINGAKNSVLKLMVAALLGQGTFSLENVPQITDVNTMIGVLRALGVQVQFQAPRMQLSVSSVQGSTPQELVKAMRASIQVMGPLLARLGHVEVAKPGGCAIGRRPLDIHLSGFQQMGASIESEGDVFVARAPRLHGADISFRYPSVGATENIMMAATLAKGRTVIRNAAREPEIVDIQDFLNQMGARIKGAGTPVITIEGVHELGCTDFTVIPDRIEAGTYLLAFLITGGSGTLENVIPEHIGPLLDLVQGMGAHLEVQERAVEILSPAKLRPFSLSTNPYPGFPTDLQPQMVAVATQAHGQSELVEAVFDKRFGYTAELKKLGAHIDSKEQAVVVHGPTHLKANTLLAGDLRGGAALVLAALAAGGSTTIEGVDHIDRGYESMETRLLRLGASVKRIAN